MSRSDRGDRRFDDFARALATPVPRRTALGVLGGGLVAAIAGLRANQAWALTDCTGQPNGTPCTPSDLCLIGGACQNGICVGGPPVTCTAMDQCHAAGTCNPSTGLCSNPPEPNGTVCNDGNPCTQNDICLNGACVGTPITGGTICGSTCCIAPQTCGGGGTPNVCGCTPLTSCPSPDNCGTIPDGCGGTINCGTCTAPQTCGGGGTPNVCGSAGGTPPGSQNTASLGKLAVSRRGLSFTITCNGPSGTSCPGTATLIGHETLRRGRVIGVTPHGKARGRSVTLAKASFNPPGGTSATVRVPLNSGGRRLLHRFRLLPSTLTVKVAGKTISRPVVFKS